MGRLAGGVAHDFNNLLTGIKGRAQFGVEDMRESDPFRDQLLEILKAADDPAGARARSARGAMNRP